jgi:hypothetical protein
MLAAVDLSLLMLLVVCCTQLLAPVALRLARYRAARKAGLRSRDKSEL